MLVSLELIEQSLPFLLRGAFYTVILSVGGMGFGLAIGFTLALMRLSVRRALDWPPDADISFIRGTPLLVQLFLIYYGLAQFGIRFVPIPAALIGFSLNIGGYTAEIIRASIASIDISQWKAAESLGMNACQTLQLAILPRPRVSP